MKIQALKILGFGRGSYKGYDENGVGDLFLTNPEVGVFGSFIEDDWEKDGKVVKKR